MSAMPNYASVMQNLLSGPLRVPQANPYQSVFGNTPMGKSVLDSWNQANIANAQRERDALSLIAGTGQSQIEQINQNAALAQGNAAQNLTSRGLGNTTVVDNIQQGIAGDAAMQRRQVEDHKAGTLANLLYQRTDRGPDMGLLAQLLAQGGGVGQASQPQQTVRVFANSPVSPFRSTFAPNPIAPSAQYFGPGFGTRR